jgi:AcrR family transcriptional regulator
LFFGSQAVSILEPEAQSDSAGVLPARQSRSRATRDRLLAAGLALVEDRAVDEVSVADIAAAAGCSVGAFYNRFRDKESFFEAAIDRVVAEELPRTAAFLAPEAWRAGDRSLPGQVVGHVIDLIRRRQGLIRAALKQSMTRPAAWDPIGDAAQAIAGTVYVLLAARPPTSGRVPTEAAVRAGMQVVMGTLFSAVVTRRGPLGIDDPAMADWLGYLFDRAIGRPEPVPNFPSQD